MDALQNNPVLAAAVAGLVGALFITGLIMGFKPNFAMADDSTETTPKYKAGVVSSAAICGGLFAAFAVYYKLKPSPMTAGFRFAMESCGCGY